MNRYLFDTNIFLEFLLDQERADEAETLLRQLGEGKINAFIATFTLHSIEVILFSSGQIDLLISFIEQLSNFKGLTIYPTNLEEEYEIAQLTKKLKLDFDDSLHYYVAKKLNLQLVSFDRHFDKVDIARKEPKDIIQA